MPRESRKAIGAGTAARSEATEAMVEDCMRTCDVEINTKDCDRTRQHYEETREPGKQASDASRVYGRERKSSKESVGIASISVDALVAYASMSAYASTSEHSQKRLRSPYLSSTLETVGQNLRVRSDFIG